MVRPIVVLSSWLAAFMAGALALPLILSHGPGGRAATVGPVVLVAVALGIGALGIRSRAAWFIAASGVPLTVLLLTVPEVVVPRHYPGVLGLAGLVAAGLFLAGPLLALRSPRTEVRVAVGTGLAAALAVGPLTDRGLTTFVNERTPLGLVAAAGLILLAAGFVSVRWGQSTAEEPTGVLRGRNWAWAVGLGLVVVGAQYWMLEHQVLPAGESVRYYSGPHTVPIWQSAFALAVLVTVTLAVVAYRRAGTAGAAWVVALAGLAYPTVVAFGPLGRPAATAPWLALSIGLAGLVGLVVGVRWSSSVDRGVAGDGLGLLGLAGLIVTSGVTFGWSPTLGSRLVGAAVTGLVLGVAVRRLVESADGAGVVGLGLAAWVLGLRALAPLWELVRPPVVDAAWPALAGLTLVAVLGWGALGRRQPRQFAPVPADFRDHVRRDHR